MAKTVIDDIIDDLNEYSRNVAKYAAIEVREELYKTAQQSIEYFYATYTPGDYYRRKAEYLITNGNNEIEEESDFTYVRTYNLKRSYKKWYHNNHDKVFTGGVILSPEFMDDIYRGSRELIFDLAYAGYHGLDSFLQPQRPSAPFGVTSPSPMEMIENKANEIIKKPDKYIQKGLTNARINGTHRYWS